MSIRIRELSRLFQLILNADDINHTALDTRLNEIEDDINSRLSLNLKLKDTIRNYTYALSYFNDVFKGLDKAEKYEILEMLYLNSAPDDLTLPQSLHLAEELKFLLEDI